MKQSSPNGGYYKSIKLEDKTKRGSNLRHVGYSWPILPLGHIQLHDNMSSNLYIIKTFSMKRYFYFDKKKLQLLY